MNILDLFANIPVKKFVFLIMIVYFQVKPNRYIAYFRRDFALIETCFYLLALQILIWTISCSTITTLCWAKAWIRRWCRFHCRCRRIASVIGATRAANSTKDAKRWIVTFSMNVAFGHRFNVHTVHSSPSTHSHWRAISRTNTMIKQLDSHRS